MGDFEHMENNNVKPASDQDQDQDQVDRLSKLPDHILLNILERIETLDALKACILSKRLLELPPMLSLLDINIGSLVRHLRPDVNIVHRILQCNIVVAAITVKMLSVRNPEIPIRDISIRFCLRHDECLSISQAVARTMATHKLDLAEFLVHTDKSSFICTQDNLLSFARRFNTWFALCPAVFAGLTRLWLRNLRFGEPDDIHNILTTCKHLEFLGLSYCDSGLRSVLQVEHAQLVVLHIEYGKFQAVQLNSVPKLRRVNYTGWSYQQDPLIFGYVPQLSKLMLVKVGVSSTSDIKLSQLLANVPWISDLRLDFQSEKIWVLPERPKLLAPVLGKLQIVNLVNLPQGCDIYWTMFVLEAASSLKELCITVWDHWCAMETNKDVRRENGYCEKANVEWQPSALHFKHKSLVKLTIYGFQPEDNFVRFIRRVMEIAVNMKEIYLHDWQVCKDCADLDSNIKVCPSRYPRTSEEKDLLREEITKELPMASPAVIHFRS